MDRHVGVALRWSRAALLAAVVLGSGLVAHLSADGLVPGRGALVVLYVACLGGAAALLGRPASTLRMVALVMGGQTFVHGALTSLSGHRGDPPIVRASVAPVSLPAPTASVPGSGRRTGSLYDQIYANRPDFQHTPVTIPGPVQHLLADLTGPHAVMALAHLVAAAFVGWWLARGERLMWAVLDLTATGLGEVGARLRRLTDTCGHVATAPYATDRRRSAGRALFEHPPPAALAGRGRLLEALVVRRGPPRAAIA